MCFLMHVSSISTSSTDGLLVAVVLAIIVCICQLCILVSIVRYRLDYSRPSYIYMVVCVQLLVQTWVAVSVLTIFLFHGRGLSLKQCLMKTSCYSAPLTGSESRKVVTSRLMWQEVN